MEATEEVASGPVSDAPGQAVRTVLASDGKTDSRRDPGLETDRVLALYKSMVQLRRLDGRLAELQRQGRIGLHLTAPGQEAALVAATAALRQQDWLFPSPRECGAVLGRGLPLQTYLDQVFGNTDDPARGRQMPDHGTARAQRVVSCSSLAGRHLPHAVGFAWAARIKGQDLVSAAFFGQGASDTADFHHALNFAGVFGTPAVFLCRNDVQDAGGDPGGDTSVATKAGAYGVAALRCDGGDGLAVYGTVTEAVERAAAGNGPTLVEMLTPSRATASDGGLDEGRDPLVRLRQHLRVLGAWSEDDESGWKSEVDGELERGIERAAAKDAPSRASMLADVYGDRPWHLLEQERQLLEGPRGPGRR